MEIVILLLEGAIKQYHSGSVVEGDKMLNAALKFRQGTLKAKKLITEQKKQKPA